MRSAACKSSNSKHSKGSESWYRSLPLERVQETDRVQWQINSNSTLPTTLSSVTILNANRTRRAFLSRIFSPLLAKDNEEPYTLSQTLQHLSQGVSKLEWLGIPSPESTRRPTQPLTRARHL